MRRGEARTWNRTIRLAAWLLLHVETSVARGVAHGVGVAFSKAGEGPDFPEWPPVAELLASAGHDDEAEG